MHNSMSILKASVHLKWVNCLGYELYPNKTVSNKYLNKTVSNKNEGNQNQV